MTGSKIPKSSTKFDVFFGRSEIQDGRPGKWLAETFSTSSLKPLKGIQRNLTGSKISMPSNKICVFQADRKTKMANPASELLRHFDLSPETATRHSIVNETELEARSQSPVPRFCFSGQKENQDGHPASDWLRHFFTSSLKPLNGIQRNLMGNKITMSSTKFVFFWLIEKPRWPPLPIRQQWWHMKLRCTIFGLLGPLFSNVGIRTLSKYLVSLERPIPKRCKSDDPF